MSALVEDLLLLARLDSDPTLDLQPTDLTGIVLNAVSDARAAGPDHTWALSLPEERDRGPCRPATACTRWWRTCWRTPAPTPRPAPGWRPRWPPPGSGR